MAKKNNARNLILAALAGGVAGSVTALLSAPTTCARELRKDIVVSAQQVSNRTVHLAGQVGGHNNSYCQQLSEGATDFAGKTKISASSVIDSVRNWRSARNSNKLDSDSDEAVNLLEFPNRMKVMS